MNIWINSCHAALEYDHAKIFATLGHEVSGLFDLGSLQRPKIPGITDQECAPKIHEDNQTRDIKIGDIGNPDVIIVHQTADFVDRARAYAEQGCQVVQIIFGQGSPAHHQALAGVARNFPNLWIVPYALKEYNIYIQAGAPADQVRMIRFGKPRSDFDPNSWEGSEPFCFVPCNSVHHRGEGCNWDSLQLLMGSGIALKVGGKDTEEVSGLGELSFDEYRGWLKKAQCYLHLGTIPAPYTLTLVEAACSGTPIVALDNGCGLATEGFGIIRSEKVSVILGEIRRLLGEEEHRKHQHEHSCALANIVFSGEIVLKQWEALLSDIERRANKKG